MTAIRGPGAWATLRIAWRQVRWQVPPMTTRSLRPTGKRARRRLPWAFMSSRTWSAAREADDEADEKKRAEYPGDVANRGGPRKARGSLRGCDQRRARRIPVATGRQCERDRSAATGGAGADQREITSQPRERRLHRPGQFGAREHRGTAPTRRPPEGWPPPAGEVSGRQSRWRARPALAIAGLTLRSSRTTAAPRFPILSGGGDLRGGSLDGPSPHRDDADRSLSDADLLAHGERHDRRILLPDVRHCLAERADFTFAGRRILDRRTRLHQTRRCHEVDLVAGLRTRVCQVGRRAPQFVEHGCLEELADVCAAAPRTGRDQPRIDRIDLARVALSSALRAGVDRYREEHERILDVIQPRM